MSKQQINMSNELSDSDIKKIVRGKTNPLWALICSEYGEICSNKLNKFCNKYISNVHVPGALLIDILVHKSSHCGYCSDNDGKRNKSVYNIAYYVTLPNNYTIDDMPALFKSFDASTCYCGGNSVEYEVRGIY